MPAEICGAGLPPCTVQAGKPAPQEQKHVGKPLRCAVPMLLYLVAATAFMWPYYSVEFRPRGDLVFVIDATIEARAALRERQFPIRVAPREWDGVRHPIFQFYGNFPYTVTGW